MKRKITPEEWENISKVASSNKKYKKYFYVKANLPVSLADYNSGIGEGVFIIVDAKTKEELDSDRESGIFFAYLANDSIYHPKLNEEAFGKKIANAIEFEHRGSRRPVLVRSKLEQLCSK